MAIHTPPQAYLDEIKAANVPNLFVPAITDKQRQNLITRSRSLLDETRQKLNRQMDAIRGPSRRAAADEKAGQDLKPYALLSQLMDDIDAAINALESRMQAGQMLQQPISHGDVIFGTAQRGEWFIGDSKDSDRWDQTEQTRRRLGSLRAERAPLEREIAQLKAEVQKLTAELNKQTQRYQRRQRRRGHILFLLLVFVLAVLSIALGAYAYLTLADLRGSIGIGLGLALLLLLPILSRQRKRSLQALEASIKSLQQNLAQLKREGKKRQLRLRPLVELINETEAEHKRLRASFRKLMQTS